MKRPYNANKTSVQQGNTGHAHAEDPLGNLCNLAVLPYVLYETVYCKFTILTTSRDVSERKEPHTHIHGKN
jgi:hypothetical protein